MRRWSPLALLALTVGCDAPQDPIPAVREAECRRVEGRVKVDGILDELAWTKAQELTSFSVSWEKRKAHTTTRARLLWDDRFLYFTAEMEDSDLYADVLDRNGPVWNNDVFELFFKPKDAERTYYEFQVNAANTPLELALPSRGAGGYHRFAPLTRLGMESEVRLQGTLDDWRDRDRGWTVEGRIPWRAFDASGGRPQPGAKWRLALCRYDYSTAFETPELSSTAPLTKADFHRYEEYGTLTFVGGER